MAGEARGTVGGEVGKRTGAEEGRGGSGSERGREIGEEVAGVTPHLVHEDVSIHSFRKKIHRQKIGCTKVGICSVLLFVVHAIRSTGYPTSVYEVNMKSVHGREILFGVPLHYKRAGISAGRKLVRFRHFSIVSFCRNTPRSSAVKVMKRKAPSYGKRQERESTSSTGSLFRAFLLHCSPHYSRVSLVSTNVI